MESNFADATGKLEGFLIHDLLSKLGPVGEDKRKCHDVVWLVLVIQGLK